jgi:hypothetical protein
MINWAARHRAGSLHIFTARGPAGAPVRSHRPHSEFMKHRETMMEINALTSKPMSACLRVFIQSLLAEQYAEVAIEECLADDANREERFRAPALPLAVDNNYNSRRTQ